jgi:hypothetical protein
VAALPSTRLLLLLLLLQPQPLLLLLLLLLSLLPLLRSLSSRWPSRCGG